MTGTICDDYCQASAWQRNIVVVIAAHLTGRTIAIESNGKKKEFSLTEARIFGTLQRAERDQNAKLREDIELKQLLGQVLMLDDVAKFHTQLAAEIVGIAQTIADRVDRQLPDNPPTADAWPEIRASVLRAAERWGLEIIEGARRFVVEYKP